MRLLQKVMPPRSYMQQSRKTGKRHGEASQLSLDDISHRLRFQHKTCHIETIFLFGFYSFSYRYISNNNAKMGQVYWQIPLIPALGE